MNRRLIAHTTGYVLLAESALLLLPAVISIIYRDGKLMAILLSAGICAGAGFGLRAIKAREQYVYAKEGFVIVALSWVLLSLFGTLPFVFSGEITSFIDAFFETVAGFSTTGVTVLADVESCSKSILFWRTFTHWLGGMGVLIFVMVILPLGGERSMHLVRAEVPGPTKGKLVPKMRDMAKILYAIYIGLTLLQMIFLCAGGMGLFDSAIASLSTAGTGGFLNYNDSFAHFDNAYFQYVISVFMLIFGINFNLYYMILIKQARNILKNEEFRLYLIIVVASVLAIMVNLRGIYGSLGETFRVSLFQVSSIVTTTGFLSTDPSRWPQFSRTLLLLLMFVGACTGSTSGGIKISRIILLFRSCKQGISHMLHPRAVTRVKLEGKIVSDATLRGTTVFFMVYVMIAAASVLLLSLDNYDFQSNFAVMAACLNNGGTAAVVLETNTGFDAYSVLSKLVLCFDMLAGRLEVFPMLFLFSPTLWNLKK